MIRGFQVSRMLRLVADLSIADQLPHHGETCIDALAAACSAHHCCAHCAFWLRSASSASRQPAVSVFLPATHRCRCRCAFGLLRSH